MKQQINASFYYYHYYNDVTPRLWCKHVKPREIVEIFSLVSGTRREHECSTHTTRVRGPCWKTFHNNVFFQHRP